MADDLLQQAAANVPAAGVGGGFVGIAIALLGYFKKIPSSQDLDLAMAGLRAEMAEKYVHKDDLAKIEENLSYIRQRVDQIIDRKPI